MADVQSNINISIDTTSALASIKNLQRQISAFHTSMQSSGNAANVAISNNLQRNLVNSINASKQFNATIQSISSTTESFTRALETNKLSMGQYFKYAGASTKTFGRLFKSELETVNKYARERVKTLQTQYIKMGRDANGALKAIAVRPLALDMDSLATKTALAAQKQALFNQLVKQGSTSLLNFGKNTQWAGRQLMVGFTLPLTYLGVAAGKTFMQMEEQVVRFKRVYGELFTTDSETEAMVNQLQALAKEFTKYGVAVADTMALAADAAAMGKMGADLTAQVAQATRLAVLGGVEQEKSLETTISLTNAFGYSAEELAKKIDFLNAVENQTVVSIEDLTIAIPKAGPVVKQLGGGIEDLAFFLTAMKEGGINASEGANALKSGLASLINPTKQASDMLAGFGINIQGIVEGNAGDVKNTVIEFAQALDTLDPLNRSRAIEQLFGKFQFARISTLFENVVNQGNQASRVMELTKATTEELAILSERELGRLEDSTSYKFKKALEDIKTALIPVGEVFLKIITPIIEFASKMIDQFNNLSDGTKTFVAGLVGALGLIGPVAIMTFGLLANGLANIIKTFGMLRAGYLRITQGTTTLTTSTAYLTEEQAQSAAVAASLDQSHAKLAQTFNVEAASLNALTAAYNRSIAAQRSFNAGSVITRGAGGAKKYASGVLSVPGPKGAGDIVPAMLAPGEAVIPADVAEENRGFISAMINGKIPGFEKGTDGIDLQRAHLQNSKSITDKKTLEQLKQIFPGFQSATPAQLKELSTRSFALGSLTADLPGWMNNAMNSRGKGIAPKDFVGYWNMLDDKMLTTATAGGMDPRDARHLKLIEKQIGERAAALASIKGEMVKDSHLAAATSEVLEKNKNNKSGLGRVAKILEQRSGVISGYRTTYKKPELEKMVANGQAYRKGSNVYLAGTEVKIGRVNSRGSLRQSSMESSRGAGGARTYFGQKLSGRAASPAAKDALLAAQSGPKSGRQLAAEKKAAEQSTARSIKKAARIKSPSKEMEKTGKNLVDGLQKGVEGGKKKVTKSAQQLVEKSFADGTKRVKQLKNGAYVDRRTNKFIPAAEAKRLMSLDRKNELAAKRRAQAAKKPAPLPPAADEGKQPRKFTAGKALGAVGAAATVGTIGASMMGGEIGAKAQELMFPVMMLASVLPMLANPVGLAVAGVAALAGGIIYLNAQYHKQIDEAKALTTAVGASSEAIQNYADFAGEVTASDQMDRRRANAMNPYQIAAGKTTFGQSFMQSDAGAALLESIGKSISTKGRGGTLSSLTNQLSTAVASGAMDAAQARSVAGAIGEALKDQRFGMQLVGNLNELIGPNGENLAKDPLGVRVKILNDTQAQLRGVLPQVTTSTFQERFQARADAIMQPKQYEKDINELGGGFERIGAFINDMLQWQALSTQVYGEAAISQETFASALDPAQIGEFVALSTIALSQQQEMADSLQLEYESRIASARAAGDMVEATRLESEYLTSRAAILQKNKETITQISTGIAGLDDASGVINEFKSSIETKFKDDPVLSKILPSMFDKLSKLPPEQNVVISAELLSGEMDPLTINELLNGEDANKIINLVMSVGGATAMQGMQLADFFTGDTTIDRKVGGIAGGQVAPQAISRQDKFLETLGSLDSTEAIKMIDGFTELSKLQVAIDEKGLAGLFAYFQDNPEKIGEIAEQTAQLAKATEGQDFTMDVLVELKNEGVVSGTVFDAIRANQEYWDSLDKDQKIKYTTVLQTLTLGGGGTLLDSARSTALSTNAYIGGLGANASSLDALQRGGIFSQSQINDALIKWYTEKYVPELLTSSTDTTGSTGGGGGGTTTTGTRDTTFDSILNRLKLVRDAAINAMGGIKELLRVAGDGKQIKIFDGLDQQLTRTGLGGGFVDYVLGFDDDIRKKFITVKDGVATLTKEGRALRNAYNASVLGDFSVAQDRVITDSKNQLAAIAKLVSAGMNYADAREAVNDADFAAAVVAENLTSNIKTLVTAYYDAEAAAESLLTPIEKFQDLLSLGSEKTAAQTARINYEFDSSTKAAQDSIRLNQDKIDTISSSIADYEYGLYKMEDKEKAINETYDERVRALDAVVKANETIQKQQQAQLDVANALATGDIAAAAQAIQKARADQANQMAQDQRAMLDNQREKALKAVQIEVNGILMTREEIQDKIKEKQDEIKKLEIETIKPLEDQVRLAADVRDTKLAALESERLKWVDLDTQINVAKTSVGDYVTALQSAQNILPDALKQANNPNTDPISGNNPNPAPEKTETQKQIDELNRRITTTRWRLKNMDLDAATKEYYESLQKKRMAEVERLGGKVDMTTMTEPGSTTKIIDLAKGFSKGGMVKYMSAGGAIFKAMGTDTVPAMLTPGEFVVSKYGVKSFGVDKLKSINSGTYSGDSVYNYSISVNVKSDANPDQIAKVVMTQIKQINSQQIRGNRI